MDLNLAAIFVRVVEAGSFSKAAAALELPKSSVSRAVTRLEAELGVRLLQRTTRALGLTAAGRAYHDRARAAVHALAEAAAEAAESEGKVRGAVRMAAPPDAGPILAPMLAAFTRDHGGVRVDLTLTPRRIDLIDEGVDLAIVAGHLEDSTQSARKVGAVEAWLVASPRYLRGRARPKAPADLAQHDCLLMRGPSATWALTGPSGEERVEVKGRLCGDGYTFHRAAAIAGAGIALVPAFLCLDEITAGALVRVLPRHAQRGAPVHLVMPSVKLVPLRVTALRDFLAASLRALPWAPVS